MGSREEAARRATAKSATRAGIGLGVAIGSAIEFGFDCRYNLEFVRTGNRAAIATPIATAIPMPAPTRRRDFAGALRSLV